MILDDVPDSDDLTDELMDKYLGAELMFVLQRQRASRSGCEALAGTGRTGNWTSPF